MNARYWRTNGMQSAAYASLFFIAIFFSALLIRAFHLGLITVDTYSFLESYRQFRWFETFEYDWLRTPFFGMFQAAALSYRQPTIVIFWFFACMFGINTMLVLWMVRPFFHRLSFAWLFALVILVLEIVLMRTFLHNVYVMSDPLYLHLLLAGVLLILGCFVRGMRPFAALLVGSMLLGLAIFTRSAGIALTIVMVPFIAWAVWRMAAVRSVRVALFGASMALMLGPNLLWSLRSETVYGHFHVVAYGGLQLMGTVMEFIEDEDVVLPDPADNERFIVSLRAFEQAFPVRDQDVYRWMSAPDARNVLQDVSMDLMPEGHQYAFGLWPIPAERRAKYDLDEFLTDMFFRVLAQHPIGYARQTFSSYRAYFAPAQLQFVLTLANSEQMHWDAYRDYLLEQWHLSPQIVSLYYPHGFPEDFSRGRQAYAILRFMHAGKGIVPRSAVIAFIAAHAMLLICAGAVFLGRRRKKNAHTAAVIVLVLASLAVSHNLIAALTAVPGDRYALPGEMPIHIAYALFVVLVLPDILRCAYGSLRRYVLPASR